MIKLIVNRLWQTVTDDSGNRILEIDGMILVPKDEDISPISNSLLGMDGPDLIITFDKDE